MDSLLNDFKFSKHASFKNFVNLWKYLLLHRSHSFFFLGHKFPVSFIWPFVIFTNPIDWCNHSIISKCQIIYFCNFYKTFRFSLTKFFTVFNSNKLYILISKYFYKVFIGKIFTRFLLATFFTRFLFHFSSQY